LVFVDKGGVLRDKSRLRIGRVGGLVEGEHLSGQHGVDKTGQGASPADLVRRRELDNEWLDPVGELPQLSDALLLGELTEIEESLGIIAKGGRLELLHCQIAEECLDALPQPRLSNPGDSSRRGKQHVDHEDLFAMEVASAAWLWAASTDVVQTAPKNKVP
jgi:hypothetical protein